MEDDGVLVFELADEFGDLVVEGGGGGVDGVFDVAAYVIYFI